MKYQRFDCGCSFPIIESESDLDKLPPIFRAYYQEDNVSPGGFTGQVYWDIDATPVDCKATWTLLGKGLTKGVFQLESSLGKTWCKKLKPEDLEHISALGAILRPGCMAAKDEDGVSATERYCRRKNKEEEISYYHPALEPILNKTFGIMCYQEHAIQICQSIAGFNLQEADSIRKAIGKKLPEVMAECRKKFIDGCEKTKIVNPEQADYIWKQIEKSQRYSFNKSHAYRYGINGYLSAYLKAHYPLIFFLSWLGNSYSDSDMQAEIEELVSEAKLFNISVKPPRFFDRENNFYTDEQNIYFGIGAIKGIGQSHLLEIKEVVSEAEAKLGKPLIQFSWIDFITQIGQKVGSAVVERLIRCGALPYDMQRKQMLEEYRIWEELTKGQQQWIVNKGSFNSLVEALRAVAPTKKNGGGSHTAKYTETVNSLINLLENPPTKLIDTPGWIAYEETELLGISLTNSQLDELDLSEVNCTCKEFLAGKSGYLVLGVEVVSKREYKTKNGKSAGKDMAFLTIKDSTCNIDNVCCFSDQYELYKYLLIEGNTVILQGNRDKKKDSFIITHVSLI